MTHQDIRWIQRLQNYSKALQIGIIEDREWMDTISSRNLTSHCYDEDEFNMVLHQIINDYLPIFTKFNEKMNP